MTDEPEIKQKGRRSVTHLTKMFENKSTNDPKRRSVQNNNALKTARNEIKKLTSEQEESDDIFDDITLPNTNRNRASSILDKVKMFNQTDITQTEKILKNVSSLGSTLLVINVLSNKISIKHKMKRLILHKRNCEKSCKVKNNHHG